MVLRAPGVTQDKRFAVATGCGIGHFEAISCAGVFQKREPKMTEAGINCRICPRANRLCSNCL